MIPVLEIKFILDLQWPKKFAYYECWSVSACIPLESRIHASYSRAGIHDRVMTIYIKFRFVFFSMTNTTGCVWQQMKLNHNNQKSVHFLESPDSVLLMLMDNVHNTFHCLFYYSFLAPSVSVLYWMQFCKSFQTLTPASQELPESLQGQLKGWHYMGTQERTENSRKGRIKDDLKESFKKN